MKAIKLCITTEMLIVRGKAFDCVDHNKLWKVLMEMRIPDCLTYLLRSLYVGQEATVRPYMEKLSGSNLGKEYDKAVSCHLAYIISKQNTSCKMPGWINHNLKTRWPGEMPTTSDMQMIPL